MLTSDLCVPVYTYFTGTSDTHTRLFLAYPNNTRIKPTTMKNWLSAYETACHHTHSLRKREDSTTETEEAAIAADPIQGCKTKPMGRKTPGNKFGLEQAVLNESSPHFQHLYKLFCHVISVLVPCLWRCVLPSILR